MVAIWLKEGVDLLTIYEVVDYGFSGKEGYSHSQWGGLVTIIGEQYGIHIF